MFIHSHTMYYDGGTISFVTDRGEACIDHRIGTKTPGRLYWGYPGKDAKMLPIDEEAFIKELERYRDHLARAIDEMDSMFKTKPEKSE